MSCLEHSKILCLHNVYMGYKQQLRSRYQERGYETDPKFK
uniref:Uncharacterized protein n=1 Tax=Rhizophora mucronata TaxID=61149 RepID=A0A2P2IJF6_RHIMU